MSITVVVKVQDGIVLATDSASSIIAKGPKGNIGVTKVYNNATKVFNICDEIPVGISSVGTGALGNASIGTLIKDFGNECMKEKSKYYIDSKNYSLKEISDLLAEFIFKEHYEHAFEKFTKEKKPFIQFFVAGYSISNRIKDNLPELWIIVIDRGEIKEKKLLRKKEEVGINWGGESEPIIRLILGYGSNMRKVLTEIKVPDNQINKVIEKFRKRLEIPFVFPMPILDAIDLAEYLTDLTIKFFRFVPGAPMVGGHINIAAITKHEGFKWIKQHLFFNRKVNQ